MNPLVSIIMPAYNAKNIEESIGSVLRQSYKNIELLIVDDCSTDDTLERIKDFKDERIVITKLQKNGGVANARNVAIEQSNGEFIAFLDADDLWHPEKLRTQINFMLKENITFSYTDFRSFEVVNGQKKLGKIRRTRETETFQSLLKKNGIGCLTVVISSKIVKNYRMKQVGHEDYILWLDILQQENIIAYNTGEVLGEYRVDSNSLSGNKLEAAKWQWNIYRDVYSYGLIKSLYYFIHYAYNGIINSI